MKRANPRPKFLEDLYKQRPDIEAIINSGDEAILRRMLELEAIIEKNAADEKQGNGTAAQTK